MINKPFSKKAQQVGLVLIIVALITAIFAFGLYAEDKQSTTGAAVGLEKITGFASHEWNNRKSGFYTTDQKWIGVDKPFSGNAYIEIKTPRTDNLIVRIDHTKTGKTTTLWLDNTKKVWQTSTVPVLKETVTYQYRSGSKWIVLGEFSDIKKAREVAEARFGTKIVRTKSTTSISGRKYYVFLSDGQIASFKARDDTKAEEIANNIANSQAGVNLIKWEPAKFEVFDKSGYSVIVKDVSNKGEALAYAKNILGMDPDSKKTVEINIAETSKTSGEWIITTDLGKYSIKAPTQELAETRGKALAENRGETYTGKEEVFTFEQFKAKNKGLSDAVARKLYNEKYGDVSVTGEDSKEIKVPEKVLGKDDEVLGYTFNNEYYENFEKANKVYVKAKADKVAKQKLKDKKLTGLNQVNKDDAPLAKDAKGNIYYFDARKEDFEPVGNTYTIKTTIGKDDNEVEVVRFLAKDSGEKKYEQFLIRLKDKDGQIAVVDDDTLKELQNAIVSRNLKLKIKPDGIKEDVSSTGISEFNDQVFELFDKSDNLVIKISTTERYDVGEGTKTFEQFKQIFLDKDEKVISSEKAKELQEKGEEVKELNVHSFREDITKKDGKRTFITRYTLSIEKGKEIFEATKLNTKTGNIIEFTYGIEENGEIIQFVTLEGEIEFGSPFGIGADFKYKEGDKSLTDEALLRARQTSSRTFFRNFESVLTSYAGLGYYATFFGWSEEDLDEWRESVDKTFATLYLGTEYWESSICAGEIVDFDLGIIRSIEVNPGRGVVYDDTKLGLAGVAAHIEASRSEPVNIPAGVNNGNTIEYLYKITFNVKNGDYDADPNALEKMRFNVILKGDRTATLFDKKIELKKRSSIWTFWK